MRKLENTTLTCLSVRISLNRHTQQQQHKPQPQHKTSSRMLSAPEATAQQLHKASHGTKREIGARPEVFGERVTADHLIAESAKLQGFLGNQGAVIVHVRATRLAREAPKQPQQLHKTDAHHLSRSAPAHSKTDTPHLFGSAPVDDAVTKTSQDELSEREATPDPAEASAPASRRATPLPGSDDPWLDGVLGQQTASKKTDTTAKLPSHTRDQHYEELTGKGVSESKMTARGVSCFRMRSQPLTSLYVEAQEAAKIKPTRGSSALGSGDAWPARKPAMSCEKASPMGIYCLALLYCKGVDETLNHGEETHAPGSDAEDNIELGRSRSTPPFSRTARGRNDGNNTSWDAREQATSAATLSNHMHDT
jgi:hypothetical protein